MTNSRVNARIDARQILAETLFFATVVAIEDGRVVILRDGDTVADELAYPVPLGLIELIEPGHYVVCAVGRGGLPHVLAAYASGGSS